VKFTRYGANMTKIEDFKKKYGNRTLGMLVGIFVNKAPPFKGDEKLAKELGMIIADLESALEEVDAHIPEPCTSEKNCTCPSE
jgi:hypothetical protein